MTTPVSNDKTPTLSTQQRPAANSRETARTAQQPDTAPPRETRQAETTGAVREPDVERASRLFRTESGMEPSVGTIRDENQARSVLARVKEQLTGNPEGALQAVRGAGEHNIQALLQAPAV